MNLVGNIIKFLFEMGQLKQTPRSGWARINVSNPESVADHTARAAQIAFVLANMENYLDPYKVCTMVVFHEIGETRVGDVNKVNARYVTADEKRAVNDETGPLRHIGEKIYFLWHECEDHKTRAGMLAKDADHLELMFTAKEYIAAGYSEAQTWFDTARSRLETESAKELAKELVSADPNDWWRDLKRR